MYKKSIIIIAINIHLIYYITHNIFFQTTFEYKFNLLLIIISTSNSSSKLFFFNYISAILSSLQIYYSTLHNIWIKSNLKLLKKKRKLFYYINNNIF